MSIALATSAAFLFTACGGSSDGAGANDEAGEPLIVYTNSDSEGRGEWLQAEAEAEGFDIEIVGAGGADATNKLIAERNNPIADVVFGLNNVYYEQLKSEDVLEPYTPAWSGEVDETLADPDDDKAYWPLVQQAIVLTYNEDAVSEAPEDWPDLWTDDRYSDRYERASSMAGATTQLVMAGILSRYQDENGDLGVSDEGWQQIEQYFQNGVPAEKDVDLFARFAEGDVDLGQMPSSSIPGREEAYDVTAGVVSPEVGVPYAVEQVAVVRGSDNQDTAKEFIDWFGSGDVQGRWAAEFDALPVNEVALEQAPPEVIEFNEQFTRQDIDYGFVQENLDSWVEKIELEYMP
ncbi:extracellular solute-binding protein [Arthrobacter echini]|uniref:Extracellular solute-binding protein n=1 Tax=Arthrobacter echini TaxID=1529066 RepID=A0A4S5E6D0_9MICC|nr:extracellular solute-binding protein [Arthrobacter echini]THJ67022.1 extracellular solute-binding protein [Arthrobacter echini]